MLPTFRYDLNGRWYKGNTHIHSTASDGEHTFSELSNLYRAAGYDFLFRTDHWVASAAASETQNGSLLWMDGVELDGPDSTGAYYHVVALGTFTGLQREMGLEQAMQAVRAQGGLLVLAHPQWTGNSFDDALRWPFDGVEVYNHECRWLNGKGEGAAYWNAVLARSASAFAFAVDDAHLHPENPGLDGGWIMVNAPECTPGAILSALRAGRFYASCGPRIESLSWDGESVHLRCSPVRYIRLAGAAWRGARRAASDGALLTKAAFSIPSDWSYAYLELEDDHGRRAWTNPLFNPLI